MNANFHLHSIFSDGTQWPEEIIARAKRFGLQIISLTDHDSSKGVPSFLKTCLQTGIQGIAGVEIE